jgi:hypothetical protein
LSYDLFLFLFPFSFRIDVVAGPHFYFIFLLICSTYIRTGVNVGLKNAGKIPCAVFSFPFGSDSIYESFTSE